MCRILGVAVFLVSFYRVFSSSCWHEPSIKDERQSLLETFGNVVNRSLYDPLSTKSEVHQFEKDLNVYYAHVNMICNTNFTLNTSVFIDLMEFSLRNSTFKAIVEDGDCIKNIERNISQCVKNHVGFFNVSSKKKHSTWFTKLNVRYDKMSCDLAKSVKSCVSVRLNACKPTVGKYVASLFDYNLKNCPEPTKTNKTTSNKAPKLSEPVIILGVGAVLLMQVTHMLRDYATP